MFQSWNWLAAGLVAFGMMSAIPAIRAADDFGKVPTTSADAGGAKVVATRMYRVGTLTGMKVRNMQDEELGKIDELVIDIDSGKVGYVALSVGGFAGIGNKLFALPWSAFKFKHDEKESYLLLDISKDKLNAAPGFDKDHWPDFADPSWRQKIDTYHAAERAVPTVR
jgi:sporulation protein YlmC with PRC-barrel domain